MADLAPSIPTDLQDPLPESSWFWRRVFVYAVTIAVLWMLWGAITQLGNVALVEPKLGVPALLTLCKWIIGFTGMMVTYYMIAPSAEQLTKMVKTVSLLKAGVQVSGRRVEGADGSSEEAKTIGLPPAPPIPGPGEAFRASDEDLPTQDDDTPPWDTVAAPLARLREREMPPPHKG